MKKITSILLLVLLVALGYWLSLPSPIDAVAFKPLPARPATGPLASNTALQQAELIAKGKINGPEDTAVDAQGRIYGGTADGRIVRVLPDGTVEEFAQTNGRPLGMDFDAAQNLIVCDAFKGLLSISPDKKITVLATGVEGIPFGFTDDLEIDQAGLIYFTDASTKFDQRHYEFDLLEGRPYGRLITYNPATKEVKVILKDLYFANGVALSKNEDFILINETYRYQIHRLWLKGENAGKSDIFVQNLPGFPDNISADREGHFWVAIPSIRKSDLDWMQGVPFLKQQIAKLPREMLPKPVPIGYAIEMDENGNILQTLQDPSGNHLHMITSVKPFQGMLYFGSLENDRIGRMKIPAAPNK